MGGKLDKLQTGAKKSSNSLFTGMKPLKDREAEESTPVKETPAIKKEEKPTEKVNKKTEPKEEEKKSDNLIDVIMEKEPEKSVSEPVIQKEEAVINKPEDIIKEVKTEINIPEEKPKKKEEKAASRYEKDKFLLLDIRGYRDYIEHMSKAANTSATKYIRGLIEKDMEKNKDIYDAHKQLEQMLLNRSSGQQ